MSAPRWATALLRRLAAPDEADVLIGDLEEAHRARVARRGAVVAALLTSLETADVTLMLLRKRVRLPRLGLSGLDFKLGVRMLVRYPVLTLVGSGSLALAIAIGVDGVRLHLADALAAPAAARRGPGRDRPAPRSNRPTRPNRASSRTSCAGAAARARSATSPPAAAWRATSAWATASSNPSRSPK